MIVFGATLLSVPLLAELAFFLLGLQGPTLLYMSPERARGLATIGQEWSGKGALPPVVWDSMRARWGVVQFNDFASDFWGGLTAEHGQMMLATGPQGIAFARCNAPGEEGRMYGGYMRSVVWIPHWVLLPFAALFPAYYVLALLYGPFFWADWLARKWTVGPGHCQHCGYNLRGLYEKRCPECGMPFGEDCSPHGSSCL